MKIKWSDFAKSELNLIFKYYESKVNSGVALKITSEIVKGCEILLIESKIGPLEELYFKDKEIRILLIGNYKLAYFIRNETIEILDVFDSRRSPANLNNMNRK